jgi:two-component system, sensor histidine kinase and response regulator
MASTFDEAELLERVDNDTAFLAETVDMLSSDGRSLVSALCRAIVANDAEELRRQAHALKGMLSNFCAPKGVGLASRVEQMGKAGDVSSALPVVHDLDKQLELLIVELSDLVKERT